MSIRVRVTLATVAIAALAVGAADATTFVLLRRYFDDRADANVREVAKVAVDVLRSGRVLTLPAFAGADRPVLVELRTRQGRVLERLATPEAIDVKLPPDLLSHPGQSQQIEAPGRRGPAFQVLAVPAAGGMVIAVVSLKNEVSTLAHLFRLNFTVGGIVLALLAAVAAVVLTRSLRPLRQIATTADAIAGGDLAARMPPAPRRSEIGRVATALNRMLAEIEGAFAQRDATEDRLRRFLADTSHELRTPLTSIRGYAELFRRGANERPEDLAQVMRAIEEEAARMSRLVDDLLLLARLDDARPLERLPVALDDVVEAAVDAARAVEPNRLLQFEFSERPLVIEGDESRLRQVTRQPSRQRAPAHASRGSGLPLAPHRGPRAGADRRGHGAGRGARGARARVRSLLAARPVAAPRPGGRRSRACHRPFDRGRTRGRSQRARRGPARLRLRDPPSHRALRRLWGNSQLALGLVPASAASLRSGADRVRAQRRSQMIEARNLIKRYDETTAVNDLTFTVRPGIVTGFLGPNGSGKSTTMRLILGLDAPSEGDVTVNGKHYAEHAAPLHEVGALLEARSVHTGRSAYNHLLAQAQTHGIPRRRVDELIELVGLESVARKRAGQFSLGMGQRLGIAAALLGDPEVVMLDEPVNGLDPDGIRWIRDLMKRLAAEGRTVFLSSHLMSEMALTADYLIVIGRGRLIADVAVDEFIRRHSKHIVRVRSPQASELAAALATPTVSIEAIEPGLMEIDGLTAEQIGREAAAKGVALYELTPLHASLEEAFMTLTRDEVEFHALAQTEQEGAIAA